MKRGQMRGHRKAGTRKSRLSDGEAAAPQEAQCVYFIMKQGGRLLYTAEQRGRFG